MQTAKTVERWLAIGLIGVGLAFLAIRLFSLMDDVSSLSLILYGEEYRLDWYLHGDLLGYDGFFSSEPTVQGSVISDPHLEPESPEMRKITADCVHDSITEAEYLDREVACHFNPSLDSSGVLTSHLAWKDGISPSSCDACHAVVCNDCRPR